MAKITRKLQKIFGLNAGTDEIAQIGSLAAGAPAFSTDPDTIQALSNFEGGWFDTVVGGNSPAMEDMNALQFLITRQLAYLMQSGVAEYDTTTTYYKGSVVVNSAQNGDSQTSPGIYYSIADDNTGNALTDVTKWARFCYDAYNAYPGTWLFNGAGAAASDTATLRAARSGRVVTLTFRSFGAITGASAFAAEYSQVLPEKYRPVGESVIFPTWIVDNASLDPGPTGLIEIQQSGIISLFKNSAQSDFTGSAVNANTGLWQQVAVSYVVDGNF